MKSVKAYFKERNPEVKLFYGYTSYIIIGLTLLSIPFFRKTAISTIDNLFITVSAISTTGLSTVSIADSYNLLGQIVILILIQMGGIGYMTFGSFIILSTKNKISKDRESVHKTSFSLPKDFSMKKFIKSIVIYTLIIEIVGALLLYFAFSLDNRANCIWSSIFHSISSFCTAGFSLYNNSFESYAHNTYLNIVVFTLSILGAIGYIVMVDVWLLLRGKKDKITFTSKVILSTTFILLILGTFFLFFEAALKNNSSYLGLNVFLESFFQSMTALTTVGFNTVPIGGLHSSSLFILTILMIIGASPSGTGGGIKSTSLSAIFGVLSSVFSQKKEYVNYDIKNDRQLLKQVFNKNNFWYRNFHKNKEKKSDGEKETEKKLDNADNLDSIFGEVFKIKLMKRTIPFDRVIHASATFIFYFLILFLGVLLLLTVEKFSFEDIFFESASALGTVGLSTGITSSFSNIGKFILIILMFIGRIGPITFGIVLFKNRKINIKEDEIKDDETKEYEDIVI
ncbi:MAG: potassium transporter TrkG [Candidatus Cloacimonadota bacterium]|nr:potassium transporter TrkG [Candidatus Cloacimonadota bacterium]